MKKLLILGSIIVIFLVGIFCYGYFTPDSKPLGGPYSGRVVGLSMYPTIKDGDVVEFDSSITPKIGDVVDFRCFNEKCLNGSPNYDNYKVKRLSDIRDNCYYFLGDNPDMSWDSRNYGWLCGTDVKILGTASIEKIIPIVEKSEPVAQVAPKVVVPQPVEPEPKPTKKKDKVDNTDYSDYSYQAPIYKPITITPPPAIKPLTVPKAPEPIKINLPKPHYTTTCFDDSLYGKTCKTTMSIY